MNVYHLKPWEIARLTDYQISKLYYHPREDDGTIVPVKKIGNREPSTLNEAYQQWELMCIRLNMSDEHKQAGFQKIREKWDEREREPDTRHK